MKTNLLHLIYNSDVITTTEDKRRILKSTVNALTAACASAMMSHVFAMRRGEIGGIDERNEQDAALEGEEMRLLSMTANGYDVGMTPYKVAQLTDGLRVKVYGEMHAFGEFAPVEALYITPATMIGAPINWDQPMSVQLYMDTRVHNASTVNDDEVKAIVRRRPTVTEGMVREILTEQAKKSQARLKVIAPDVLVEINSLDLDVDIDAFTTLPTVVQVRVAEHINRSLNREYARLLPRSLRDLEMSGECDLIEAEVKVISNWVATTEHEQRVDSQSRLAA